MKFKKWSNKTNVYFLGISIKHVWWKNKTTYYLKNIPCTVKHGGGSTMLWGIFFPTCYTSSGDSWSKHKIQFIETIQLNKNGLRRARIMFSPIRNMWNGLKRALNLPSQFDKSGEFLSRKTEIKLWSPKCCITSEMFFNIDFSKVAQPSY